jgi:hypothetical protein
MGMNPNLICQAVNVMMGGNLYELKFRVKLIVDENNPQPMDVDNNHRADDESALKEKEGSARGQDKTNRTLQANTGGAVGSGKGAPIVAGKTAANIYHICWILGSQIG